MAVNYFTPAAYAQMAVGTTSSTIAIPGSSNPALKVTNAGPNQVAVLLGTANPVVVTPSTGLILNAGETQYLGIGSNTFIGAIALNGPQNSTLNMAAGT